MIPFLVILIIELAIAGFVWLLIDWWQGPGEDDPGDQADGDIAPAVGERVHVRAAEDVA